MLATHQHDSTEIIDEIITVAGCMPRGLYLSADKLKSQM